MLHKSGTLKWREMTSKYRREKPSGVDLPLAPVQAGCEIYSGAFVDFNGRKIIGKQLLSYQHQVELAACLSGCGAVASDQFYLTTFPQKVIKAEHTIAHLELIEFLGNK